MMEWISVEERLPEEHGSYLICAIRIEDGYLTEAVMDMVYFYHSTKQWDLKASYLVTHWVSPNWPVNVGDAFPPPPQPAAPPPPEVTPPPNTTEEDE